MIRLTNLEQLTMVFVAPLDMLAKAAKLISFVGQWRLANRTMMDYSVNSSQRHAPPTAIPTPRSNLLSAPSSSQRKKSFGISALA